MKTINTVKNFSSKENDCSLLVFGIVRQAVHDFRQYFIQLKVLTNKTVTNWMKVRYYKEEIFNVLKFFRSEYYFCLCEINKDEILKRLVEEMKENKKKLPDFRVFIDNMIEYALTGEVVL